MECNTKKELYPITEPFTSSTLAVSDIHTLFYEIAGNPDGKPVILLHGGPGVGSFPEDRSFFDPSYYKIIQFDQRGAGKSTPFASLENNTTWDLVSDIEKLREHLNISKWHIVYGCSWGSTLSLVYAQSHPDRVFSLVIKGVFLFRKEEMDFFYKNGTSWLFPDHFDEFINLLPEEERDNPIPNYYKRLTGENEEEKLKFAKAWTKWELTCLKHNIDYDFINFILNSDLVVPISRIECHYFVNGGFLNYDNQIINDCEKIKHIPIEIISGRYDVICPVKSSWDLKKKFDNVNLTISADSGHLDMCPSVVEAIINATNKFKI